MSIWGIEIIEELEKLEPPLRLALISILKKIEKVIGETIKREDFQKLSSLVEVIAEEQKNLAEAQRKTEERLNKLSEEVKSLAEAQRRTEERLSELTVRVDQLAEAQRKTEERLNQLAEAQRRTEERLNQLAEAQRRTEERLNQLAEAQKKTEEELRKLVKEHEKTRKDLGSLTHSFGYFLENESYKYLPVLLERDYNLKILEPLDRKFIEYPQNRYDEINIFGKGKINGKEVYILGEVKSQLSKRHVDEFLKKVSRIKRFYNWETFLILVTHMPANPQVEKYVKDLGIVLYKSSQFR